MNLKMKNKIQFKNINDIPIKITDWIGSTSSIVVHTFLFTGIFILRIFGIATSDILLILTTLVSLEAIYLSIFIQITVNRNTQSLGEFEEDIGEIQSDIDKIEDKERMDKINETITTETLSKIQSNLQRMMDNIEKIKNPKI